MRSSTYLSREQQDAQVAELLADIRARLDALGIGHDHLSNTQLEELIAWTVYRLQMAGRPVTLDSLMAAWGTREMAVVA